MAARSFVLGLLIVAAAICLVLGLTLPVVKLTRLYFWTDQHSLASIVWVLYKKNELFLAAIIFVFSIVFPAMKLFYLLAVSTLSGHGSGEGADEPAAQSRVLQRLAWLGKWSMLDVLVLALVVFYAKSSGIAEAVSLPGVYFFAASVILTMLAYGLAEKSGARAGRSKERNIQPLPLRMRL